MSKKNKSKKNNREVSVKSQEKNNLKEENLTDGENTLDNSSSENKNSDTSVKELNSENLTQKVNSSVESPDSNSEKSTEKTDENSNETSNETSVESESKKSKTDEKKETDKSELKKKYLNILMKFGILTGVLIVMMFFLILFALIGKNQNREMLRNSVNETLSMYCSSKEGNFSSIEAVAWKNGEVSFHSNYVVFRGKMDGKLSDKFYAFMIRENTIYGPVSAVYIFNSSNNNVEFAGISDLNGKAKNHIIETITPSQISYWANRIPKIFAAKSIKEVD